MDLYYGSYSPVEIAKQIVEKLKSESVKELSDYESWLYKNGKDYQTMVLNDYSVWALRHGEESRRYVHIHPGRYSPHTVRVKALTLKTAICALALLNVKSTSEFDVNLINEARKKFLNASPLKQLDPGTGLGKLMILFNSLGK